MNSFKLTFESPWALLLLIPALALVLLPWLFLPKERRAGFRKTAPLVLHGIAAVLLVLILLGAGLSTPEIPDTAPEEAEGEQEPEEAGSRFLLIADSRAAAESVLPFLPEEAGADIRTPARAPLSLTDLTN